MVRWGHFSDLHFQFDVKEGLDTKILRPKLLEKLKADNITLDYIFITGDISHKGIYDEETTKFIQDIATATCCEFENIIICPGNHDAPRKKSRKNDINFIIEEYVTKNKLVIDYEYEERLYDKPFVEFWESCKKITGSDKASTPHYVRKLDGINLYVLNTAVRSTPIS